MKKYFLLTILFFIPLLGLSADFTIDERKSDIYFANGVLTDDGNATINLKLISEFVFIEQYIEDIDRFEKEINFKKAYNQTFGTVGDFYEALMQKADESFGWEALYSITKAALMLKDKIEVTLPNGEKVDIPGLLFDRFIQIVHDSDLDTQVISYRESIRQGHGVVVLAHSQGNLFTNEAYQKMILVDDEGRDNDWLKEYFTRVSIATPSSDKFGGDIVVSFHNDPVPDTGSLPTIDNPNKAYLKNAQGEIIEEDAMSADFHDFKYYMGENSVQGTGQVGSGYHSKVSTDVAKIIIMDFIKNAIDDHRKAQSQWSTNEESDENTKDYRITVKHIYDVGIVMDEKVFPFAANKKLYQVPDTSGTPHYVKASFGGDRILSADDVNEWEVEENQFYKLEGTDPVEYIEGEEVDLNKGLVAYYEFEDNTDDSSENGVHGTEYGGMGYDDGVIGRAGSFNGSDSYIDISDLEDSLTTTFSLWFKTGVDKYTQTMIGDYVACAYDKGFDFGLYGTPAQDNPRISFHGSYRSSYVNVEISLADNQWHHVIGEVTDGWQRLFLDGKLVGQLEDYIYVASQTNFYIGKTDLYHSECGDGTESWFDGLIDELRIYNRLLNDSEIQKLYTTR